MTLCLGGGNMKVPLKELRRSRFETKNAFTPVEVSSANLLKNGEKYL